MKNVTFKADESLLLKARAKASRELRSLNEVFNEWLKLYAEPYSKEQDLREIMKKLSYVNPGQKFNRDDLNER